MEDDMKIVGQNQKIRMNKNLRLGRGGCGTVYTGQFRAVRCAVKRIELDAMNQMVSDNFRNELHTLKSSIHANIVRYLFDDEDDNFYYIAMELCKHSMHDYIKDQGYDAIGNDALAIRIIYQCTSGVEYLHGKNITHRDIKPANMLLSEISDYVTIKLADFGMCKVLDPDRSSTVSSEKGTDGYNAYEVAKRLRNKLLCDIFSLAIAFHEFSTQGGHPFGTGRREAQLNIKAKKKPDLEKVVSKPFGELIAGMLNHNWDERPTASHVLVNLKTVFTGGKDQLGEAIASSLLFPKKNVTTNESKDLLKENVSHAEHRVEYTMPAESSLQAVPAMPKDEGSSPSPKKRKSETQGKKKKKAVTKNPAEKIEQLIADYKAPKSKLKSETPNAQLRNAEFSIRRKKWQEAREFLDCAVKLLEPMGSVEAQFLLDQAEKAASKFLYVMSILLHVCSASQFRNEALAQDGAFRTSECVFKIYKLMMDALRPKKAVGIKELAGLDVRYRDIAQYFVIPLLTSECTKLRQFCESKKLQVYEVAKQNAYAVSWFSVLLNYFGEFTKAADMAETARKEIAPYFSSEHQTYSRLLQEEGKAKTQLEKYDEAADLLNRSLKINNEHEKDGEKWKTNIRFINKAIEDNESKRAEKFAGVLVEGN